MQFLRNWHSFKNIRKIIWSHTTWLSGFLRTPRIAGMTRPTFLNFRNFKKFVTPFKCFGFAKLSPSNFLVIVHNYVLPVTYPDIHKQFDFMQFVTQTCVRVYQQTIAPDSLYSCDYKSSRVQDHALLLNRLCICDSKRRLL